MPTSASVCITSRHASRSSFSMNGSPTCTAGRFSADFSSNSADAMVRLDERGMIVRFDLEDRSKPLADIDGAGVLPGTLQHLRALGRQRLQVHARALIAAVLGPHHGEDAELGQVRLAAEKADDA